ncbi:MAG: flagellar motor protein MotB [Nitrospirales bacterium]
MKKKHEEHENHERWLVSYADFITLLFAFFVVMYAVSSVNEGQYRTLSESLVSAFSNHKPLGNPSIIELPLEQRNEVLSNESPKVKPSGRSFVKIANAIQAAKIPQGVSVKSEARGLNIRLSDDALFGSGSATLRPEVKKFLDLIAGLIKGLPNYIAVEGHTDSLPIRERVFLSDFLQTFIR